MPKKRKTRYKKKKTGLELLAAVCVAIGAVLCIVFGLLSVISAGSLYQDYAFGTIIREFPVKEILAIVFGVIIIVIEGFNKLDDYWSIILIFILGIIAGTIGMLLIIIGALIAIIEKVRKE
ncbi:MAG: hypothetical protein HWN66_05400 [Candidatus Helarchaeota archaeon]|nr:hypothetical protein [Candidatus Helarchaeota archaeon]